MLICTSSHIPLQQHTKRLALSLSGKLALLAPPVSTARQCAHRPITAPPREFASFELLAASLHAPFRFSPDQTALFVDYADETEDFSFYDNSGSTYTVPYTPRIVKPQWGNEYYYSGGGYALSFACSNNQTMASSCQALQKSGYVTCNCSLRFQDLIQPPTAAADGSSSTFLDASTRALDVSFLVFSPSLESYVFFHMLFEFSETGTVRVWDDYVTFSGRYSKQFSNEKLTALRVSQYVTIVYALMYLFYEYEDWKVLRARIPDVSRCSFVR
jgi:hypothetical protein